MRLSSKRRVARRRAGASSEAGGAREADWLKVTPLVRNEQVSGRAIASPAESSSSSTVSSTPQAFSVSSGKRRRSSPVDSTMKLT